MAEESIERVLQNVFLKSTRSDWKKIAMREVSGKDPFEILSWRGKDEILFLPYYDADDVANLTPASQNSSSVARSWINVAAVTSPAEGTANALALDQLSNGADGILFDTRQFQEPDLGVLLKDIEWPYCFVAFQVNEPAWNENALSDFLHARKFDPASVTGALFWESIPKKNNFDFYFNHCKNFRCLGLVIPGASPVGEISHALMQGAQTLEALQSRQVQALRAICFSIAADASVLETAAKFKALRMLWRQVAVAYGHQDYNANDLHIHARSLVVADATYGPHENMLKGTFSAMAAALGGCDSLTVMSPAQPALLPRWSRNVSAILKEESFFDRVSDPLSGSYTFEVMVNEIARKAWSSFQEKWRAYEQTT